MNADAKKRLLRSVPSGLYVIGVKSGSSMHAFTCSWLSQISMKPPCIVMGVRNGSKSLEMIKEDKVLVVNFVRKENQKTLEHFFKAITSDGNRLGDFPVDPGRTGAPILREAIGFLECNVLEIHEGFGDHAAVLAEVIEAETREDADPLIMSDTPWHYGG